MYIHTKMHVHKHNTQNITHANNKITPSEIGLYIQQLYIRCGYIILKRVMLNERVPNNIFGAKRYLYDKQTKKKKKRERV